MVRKYSKSMRRTNSKSLRMRNKGSRRYRKSNRKQSRSKSIFKRNRRRIKKRLSKRKVGGDPTSSSVLDTSCSNNNEMSNSQMFQKWQAPIANSNNFNTSKYTLVHQNNQGNKYHSVVNND